MRDLLLTNDPVLLSFAQSLLAEADVPHMVFDQNISMIEGSIGAFPRRLVVPTDDWCAAARILREAGLAQWVKNDEQ